MKIIVRTVALAVGMLVTNAPRAQQHTTINDKDMSVIDFDDIKYPSFARQAMIQGVVVVQVRLDNNGKVVDAVALSGHELLIPDCLANAKRWRFQPNARRSAIIVYNFRMPYAACKSETLVSFSMLQAPNFVNVTACSVRANPTTSPGN
jgi:TonB family protein